MLLLYLTFFVIAYIRDSNSAVLNELQTSIFSPFHSLFGPYADDAIPLWKTNGAVSTERENVQISPNKFALTGALWNEIPIISQNFSVNFQFYIQTKRKDQPSAGFAFWFVDNPPVNGTVEPALLGGPSKFRGFVVAFTNSIKNEIQSTVSIAFNDGTKDIFEANLRKDIPLKFREHDYFLDFLLIIKNNQLIGMVRNVQDNIWAPLFDVKGSIPAKGYIGFSGDSYPTITPQIALSIDILDKILLRSITTRIMDKELPYDNLQYYDVSLNPTVKEALKTRIKEDMAIEQIADAVFVLTQGYAELLSSLNFHETTLKNRFSQVVANIKETELNMKEADVVLEDLKTRSDNDKTSKEISTHLNSLKEYVKNHSEAAENAKAIQVNFAKVIADTPRLEEIHKKVHQVTYINSILTIISIVAVILFVILVWKKTRDLEKCHLL